MNINILSRRSLGNCFDRYVEWLDTTRRYAERSRREYRDDVAGVVEYLQERCHLRSVTMVQRRHLGGYLAHCGALGHAASTRRRSVAAIRSFFSFLMQEGVIRRSPAELLLPPERETRPPRVLSEAEYTRLREAAGNARDSAIIELALQTGIRLLEITHVRLVDVVLPHRTPDTAVAVGSLRIVGRGSHRRTVTLNTRACNALTTYLAEREETGSPALFLTKFGTGIGACGIENIMKKQCEEAGIVGASVHTLRHTMAVEMLKRGAIPAIVGKALGHESAETMDVYLDIAREEMDTELQRGEL